MSYALSEALQSAIFQHLQSDVELSASLSGAIYDAVPQGDLPATYVMLGAETVRDRSDMSQCGAEHLLTFSVLSSEAGFAVAKSIAGRISDILQEADLSLSRGRLVFLKFDRATARREGSANTRRIDLKFRARVEDN
ncbi:DUF3168 domain-containing protein [Shimia thalassica]|uniref:DUF3168 domain-containing protein n=1 Tax=Shimia thalassica TaxID=1715693 RepID=UPI0026E4607C|nr:DUF3168 domain-containing protein [Shimia thalassica]MDO6478081.1 DUF3168 domain-containing protein [Shimia thalassica]